MDATEKCKKKAYHSGAWNSYSCGKKAWKDGYCKMHHPDEVKRRDKERADKRQLEEDAKKDRSKNLQNELWNEIKNLYYKNEHESFNDFSAFIDSLKNSFVIRKKSNWE